MKYINLKLSAIFLFALGLTGIHAQTAIPAAGGDANGSGGTASYSVGQIVYTTNSGGTNGSVAQGVQQPFEISELTAIEEAKGISLVVSAYPNPTNDYLTLQVDASTTLSIQLLSYQLFDISGKLLETKKLESNQTNIVMSNLVPAIYFLKIVQSKKELKTFKIVKR